MEKPKNRTPPLTKITAPRTNNPVLRQRLFQRLDHLRDISVVWIIGPPGSGKTTLASTYINQYVGHHLWYQLDAGDADIATFFHYFRLAVMEVMNSSCHNLPVFTPEYLPGLIMFVRRYAEIISTHLQKPTVIVLDNYEQLPTEAPLHAVIRELASCLSPEITFLVLSRAEPPPTFARLRLHGSLVILDGSELNLTLEEAKVVATTRESLAVNRSDSQRIQRVYLETQGWFAGFTLLLVDPRDTVREFSNLKGTRQVIFDYFATELFIHLPPSIQRGLLCTALLPVMTIPNVDQLTGDPEIAVVLADLMRQNCFIVQRGQTEVVYEYHALFRAFLLSQTVDNISPDDWRQLQKKAADLLANSRQIDEAANLYRAVEAWPELAALALGEAPMLISAGRYQTLEQWLRWLPADLFKQYPWLLFWLGMARIPFDPVEARGYFEQAYAGFDLKQDVEGLYSTWAGIMETFFFEWHDLRVADRWIAEFEVLRARHPEFPSRAVELRTYLSMGTLLHRQPQHPFVPAWAERAESLLSIADRERSVLLGGYLIIWNLWCGDSAKAMEFIHRLAPWTQSPDFSPLVSILWSCAVGLYHSVHGDREACLTIIEGGLSLAEKTGLHWWDFLLSAQAARCYLIAGDLDNADTWIASMDITVRSHSHINGGFLEHLRCNAAAQRGNWLRALEHGRRGLSMALESGVPFLEGHCRIDLARALIGQGDTLEWPEHIRVADTIGQEMGSKVLQYLCRETQAYAAFERGEKESGLISLMQALILSKEMSEPIWQMAGPLVSIRMYEYALNAGIAIEYVRKLIRQRGLVPSDPSLASDHWPWPVRIYTLGRFEILCEDEPIRSARKAQHKPLELIKVLCALGGHAIHQDRVTDIMWPDAEGDAARQMLTITLHRLRKLLQNEKSVRLEDSHLSLDSRHLWVDATIFDRIAHHPDRLDRVSLQCALNRYRGHFLEGESAHWALAFRDRLRSHFLKMSERLGNLLEQESDWSAAIDCYYQAIEIVPVAESFYHRLMICHEKLGQRTEALAVFLRCRKTLLTHLGISPAHDTQALYQRLLES